ncbi:MAG: DUF748 domain-containing protein [Chloroflexaceae bacterium]|nr:DUF748 domain-containing protein [Chloroflexaceae bacterium]
MSNSSSPPPLEPDNQPPSQSNGDRESAPRSRRFLGLTPRKWAIYSGVAVTVLAVGGYFGLRYFVDEYLAEIVEGQLENIINREVEMGEVKSFSLNRVVFGPSSLPRTSDSADYLTIQEVSAGYRILPFLWERRLVLDIIATDPELYVAENREGAWLDLNLDEEEEGPRPKLDIKLTLVNGEAIANPYRENELITAEFAGNGRFVQNQERRTFTYDVSAALASGGAIALTGTTELGEEDVSTLSELQIAGLNLPPLSPLLPVEIAITSGELDANLDIKLPSVENLEQTRIDGRLDLRNVTARLPQVAQPLRANLGVDFRGEQTQIQTAQANLGPLQANLSGQVNWQSGYDLDINLRRFSVEAIANLLQRPLPLSGQLQADLQVSGEVEDPLVQGNLSAARGFWVDRLAFTGINANISASLSRLQLKSLRAIPAAGGQIQGEGLLLADFRGAIWGEAPLDLTEAPANFTLDARLPVEEILAPYYQLPAEATLGTLTAQGEFQGTLADPKARLQWRLPAIGTTAGSLSGAGTVLAVGDRIALEDTALKSGEGGTLTLEGGANLEQDRFLLDLRANSLRLDPFLPANFGPQVRSPELVRLNQARARLSGKIADFQANRLEGAAQLNLTVDGGEVALLSQLTQGRLVAETEIERLSVSPLLTAVDAPIQVTQGRAAITVPVTPLFKGQSLPLERIDAQVNAQLAIAQGAARVAARLQNGQLLAQTAASNVALTPFLPGVTQAIALRNGRASFSGPVAALQSLLENPEDSASLNRLALTALGDVTVPGGVLRAGAQLNQGQVVAEAATNNFPISQFLPQIQQPITVRSGRANLSGPAQALIEIASNPQNPGNLTALNAQAQGQLAIAGGTVGAAARLNAGR